MDSRAARRSDEIPALPEGVRFVTLENGLTIIVREDRSAPVVSAQAWCRAGSIDEGRWLGAGLSHVLEHMLFKGTQQRPPGRIDREVQEAGGYMNAYTSFDRTVYWINVPNTGAAVALDVLCDIMRNATLPPEELTREMDVIRREMDMGHDDPGRHSGRRLFETAYTRSPYRYTVIGYLDIFNRLTREDIVAYYREKYAPNNLFFVVVGDIGTEAAIRQISEAFAGVPARPLPPTVPPTEPPQVAPREITEEGATELTHVHYAWHIPDIRHPDVPLLDVLAVLLGGGRSSRLFQEVRQKHGLVTGIDAWTYSPGNAGLAGVSAVLEAERFGAADEAIRTEVKRLQETPVSPAEVEKAVKQFIAGTLATRKTMQGQAQDLGGNWMAAGDLNFSERYLAAVREATPEALQRVARTYLTASNRTRYALVPKGVSRVEERRVTVCEEQAIRKHVLANGLRLLIKEDRRLPFVAFQCVLRGGVLAEDPTTNGSTFLLSRMLLQGTPTRSADEIATRIESVGGQIDTYAGNNSFGVSAEVLEEDFDLGLELLAEVLLKPAFPAEHLARERDHQLAAIRAQRDQLLQTAFRSMRRKLFGNRGYGLELLGAAGLVEQLTEADLRAVHARLVRPDQAVLAIYGAVHADAVLAAVERSLGGWAVPGAIPANDPEGEVLSAEPVSDSLGAGDKKQAVLALGFPGVTVDSDDRFALGLIQEACSDLGSRLFARIRDELGLAYYVGCQSFVGLVPGYFAFYAGTSPEHAEQVEAELRREAAALAANGLSDEELRRAKAKVIGHKKIARQELGHYAMVTALDELYGLGYQRVDEEDAEYESVTVEDTARVAGRYLRPDASVLAVVGPEAVAR
jgi:zinc protease